MSNKKYTYTIIKPFLTNRDAAAEQQLASIEFEFRKFCLEQKLFDTESDIAVAHMQHEKDVYDFFQVEEVFFAAQGNLGYVRFLIHTDENYGLYRHSLHQFAKGSFCARQVNEYVLALKEIDALRAAVVKHEITAKQALNIIMALTTGDTVVIEDAKIIEVR